MTLWNVYFIFAIGGSVRRCIYGSKWTSGEKRTQACRRNCTICNSYSQGNHKFSCTRFGSTFHNYACGNPLGYVCVCEIPHLHMSVSSDLFLSVLTTHIFVQNVILFTMKKGN